MKVALVDRLFAFGRIVASTVSGKANAVLVNLRLFEDGEEDTEAEEATEEPLFGTLGAYCRPDSPTADGYAEVLSVRLADGARPVACRDLRLAARVNPKEGELGLSHYGGGFLSLKWNDDHAGTTATLMAPVLTPGAGGKPGTIDKSHSLSMNTAAGNNAVTLLHMDGMAVLMNDGQLVLRGKGGAQFISITEAEILLNGIMKFLGGIVAGNPTTALPVALYPGLAPWIAEVQLALVKIAAMLNAPGAVTGAPLSVTPPVAVPTPVTAASQTLKASPI